MGRFVLPLPLTAGRGEATPALRLEYSSGRGNGPFGFGWQLGLPGIARRTDRGVPRYEDGDTLVFGGEELVPLSGERWVGLGAARHRVTRFRPRCDQECVRIERWDGVAGAHFRVASRSNATAIYGRHAASRLADPGDPTHVLEWLLEELVDAKGNRILYEYAGEDPSAFDDELRAREHPHGHAQRYLRRVLWVDAPDRADAGVVRTGSDRDDPGRVRESRYLVELVLDYGDGGRPSRSGGVPPAPGWLERTDARWTVRPDPFSWNRAGFELRTLRRCEGMVLYHHFPELGPEPTRVSSVQLGYEEAWGARHSLLRSFGLTGYRREEGLERACALPPVLLAYTDFKPHEQHYQALEAPHGARPARSLADGEMAFVDLDGIGLPDLVEGSADGWRRWRNRGDGVFELPRSLPGLPGGLSLADPAVHFSDVDGDGRPELMVLDGPLAGTFALDEHGRWRRFRSFAELPSFDPADPALRLIDLSGDGLPDALHTGGDRFLWFRSLGADGFAPPTVIPRVADLARFPDLTFDDPSARVRLADMTGDGLLDVVTLHEGGVDYWPNLGGGRFGRRVSMRGRIDLEPGFDPRRLFLVDVDGTGCADLVYVDVDRVHLWLNQSGNAWSEGETLRGTPRMVDPAAVRFVDLYGHGTQVLVVTFDDFGQPGGNYKAIDLCGGRKPYLLQRVDDGAGGSTCIEYVPSSRLAREDRESGAPWVTRLPFPVQVVARVETFDRVRGARRVVRFRYAHGHWDGRERELAGFARVDRQEGESFTDFSAPGLAGASPANARPEIHAPPTLTRTWFHTGAHLGGPALVARLAEEAYQGDAAALRVGDHRIADGGAPAEALRALRGKPLRSEVYALDDGPRAGHPYTVEASRWEVRCLSAPAGGQRGVYLAQPLDQLVHHYDRDPTDPRVEHQLLRGDDFGNVTDTVHVAYPRRLPAEPEQGRLLAVHTHATHCNQPDDALAHHVGLLAESHSDELGGIPFTGGPAALTLDQALAPAVSRRRVRWGRSYFKRDAAAAEIDLDPSAHPVRTLASRLPLGRVESLALPYEQFRLVFTDAELAAVHGADVDDAMLRAAGYHREPDVAGVWWLPSGQQAFDPARRWLPSRGRSALGGETRTEHDRYALVPTSSVDPAGNRTTARLDYVTLGADQLIDANGRITRVAFDALGFTVATAVIGPNGEGDALAGFSAHVDAATVAAALADPLVHAAALIGSASTRTIHDVGRMRREGRPNTVMTITRTRHVGEPADPTGVTPPLQITVSYLDGSGHAVQTKSQAEPDPSSGARRWAATGWTLVDNHDRPIQKYQPFFSAVPDYEPERLEGVSETLFHDPIGRPAVTLWRDGSYEKIRVGPWGEERWDRNDTVATRAAEDPDVLGLARGYLARTGGSSWLDRRIAPGTTAGVSDDARAAQATLPHAATPARLVRDPLGRAFLSIADAGRGDLLESRLVLDIEGNQVALLDARQIQTRAIRYDHAGRRIATDGPDAGQRRVLLDVLGAVALSWDGNGARLRRTYDAAHRPVETWCRPPSGGRERLLTRLVYGDDPALPTPKPPHARGRLVRVEDGAGVVEYEGYDFKGNLVASTRRLTADHATDPDWSGPVALDAARYRLLATYDALNRPLAHWVGEDDRLWAEHIVYDGAGLVAGLSVAGPGDDAPTSILDAVHRDALGRVVRVDRGNGISTTCEHEPETTRRSRVWSSGPDGSTLQDLRYSHDPVGNPVLVRDQAFATVFFTNQRVDAACAYAYDPLYRLVSAQGREHVAMGACQHSGATTSKQTELFAWSSDPLTNGQAVRGYVETYTYDRSGNLRRIAHRAARGAGLADGWTRDLDLVDGTNRAQRSLAGCPPDGAAFVHDGNGNVTVLPSSGTLAWDAQDRLRRVITNRRTAVTPDTVWFDRDAGGQRVRKVVEHGGRKREEIVYVGGLEIYRRYDATGPIFARETKLVSLDDELVARVEHRKTDLLGREAGEPERVILHQLTDHLGSSVREIDGAGRTISYEEYAPYGGTSFLGGRSDLDIERKRRRFQAKERDEETGLYDFGARMYAPWLGRFVSPDPAGLPDGASAYAYARGNPIRFRDPDGMDTTGFVQQAAAALVLAAETQMTPEQRMAYLYMAAGWAGPGSAEFAAIVALNPMGVLAGAALGAVVIGGIYYCYNAEVSDASLAALRLHRQNAANQYMANGEMNAEDARVFVENGTLPERLTQAPPVDVRGAGAKPPDGKDACRASENPILDQKISKHAAIRDLWLDALARAQKPPNLTSSSTTGEARTEYNNQMSRFVTRLTNEGDPRAIEARKIFESAGFSFARDADGKLKQQLPLLAQPGVIACLDKKHYDLVRVSGQHLDMIQFAPQKALDPDNLAFQLGRDNMHMDIGPAHIRSQTVDIIKAGP